MGNGFPNYSVPDAPPDTNLAVGDSQILQWVNVSFAVFDKYNGAIQAGPIDGNMLFSALGGPCAPTMTATSSRSGTMQRINGCSPRTSSSPPTTSASRYPPVLTLSVPTNLYQFSVPGNGFPDYPKWGRWTNTWTQTMNNFGPGGSGFQGPQVCAYDRTKLLSGNPSPGQVCFQLASDGDSLLPADIDSPNNPPPNEDQFLIGSVADVSNTKLSLYSLHTDWAHPSSDFLVGNHNTLLVNVPAYTGSCGGNYGGACVPQKGITDELDSLGDRLMYRFAYYNDTAGGKQHWYVNHDVEASGGQIGVRWYEFQAPQIAQLPFLRIPSRHLGARRQLAVDGLRGRR